MEGFLLFYTGSRTFSIMYLVYVVELPEAADAQFVPICGVIKRLSRSHLMHRLKTAFLRSVCAISSEDRITGSPAGEHGVVFGISSLLKMSNSFRLCFELQVFGVYTTFVVWFTFVYLTYKSYYVSIYPFGGQRFRLNKNTSMNYFIFMCVELVLVDKNTRNLLHIYVC